MRLELDRRAARLDPWVEGILGVLGAGALIAAAVFPFHRLPSLCGFKNVTGHPCVACGMTRSWVHMIHGRVEAALIQNPVGSALFAATAVALVYLAARRLWRVPAVRLRTSPPEALAIRITIGTALIINWAYVWLSGVA